jgi:peptide deformylase
LDIHAALARPLVAYLSEAFDAHLHAQYYPCLCMHHVNPGAVSNTLYQVCGTTQIRGPLVNPVLTGRGNETDYWTESSIACATLERGQRRARYRTIWLQWHDVATGQQMFGRFDGAVAACMQLAMDEMNMGNKVCN